MTRFPSRLLGAASLLLVALASDMSAQKPPYDVFPPAEAPYYRVRYEASAEKGELPYAVNYTVWIPPGVKTLRGVVVHQHGCGEGSCKSGLTGAYDLHWQALAKKHDCALLSPSYEQPDKADCQMWCDPRNGSDAAFRKGLADLGAHSGHPELPKVPWALWGHSGGGHWAGGMVMLHPDRVAAAWLRSGVSLLKDDPSRKGIKAHTLPDAALKVPLMCNLGTKEGVTVKDKQFAGVWPANETFFNEVRGKGGLVGVAVDPLSSHDCGNQRYLAIPWLDACLTARLPKAAGDPLKPMPPDATWLAPVLGGEAAPAAKYSGEPLKAAWLPNEAIAKAWAEYVKDTKVSDTTPPPAPTNVRVQGGKLTWECEADLESGLASFVVERDGQFLANVPEQGKNPFGRPVLQNLQYSDTPTQPLVPMVFTDAKPEPGKAHTYRVVAVNTVGLKSKPSADATRVSARDPEPTWKAGVATAVATPETGVWLAGYGTKRPPDGKLHDIWMKALALEAPDGERVVLVTSDFQGVPKEMTDRVFADLKKKHKLERRQVMITFSHNHCGPRLGNDLIDYYPVEAEQEKLVAEYTTLMEAKLVELVGDALKNLAPAALATGRGKATFGVNRRNNREADVADLLAKGEALKGPVDHAVPVMTVTGKDGKLVAILFGYACHPTTLSFTKWCGDYPGFAQLALEKNHPGAAAMFVNTCGGDQNPLPRRKVELCEKYGQELAQAVEEVLKAPLKPVAPGLKTAFEYVDLPYEKVVTREDLQAAAKDANAVKKRWGERLLKRLDAGATFEAAYPYPVHAWRLGSGTLMIGMGAETVVDYALAFKAEYGPDTWVCGYADDMISYIPSRRVWLEGGYEGGPNLFEYGRPALRWDGDVEARITKTVSKLVKAVGK